MSNLIVVILSLILIVYSVSYFIQFKTDDSDKSFWTRSGMIVYTDYKTGLQYLSTGKTLTPRLNKDGSHMRKGE